MVEETSVDEIQAEAEVGAPRTVSLVSDAVHVKMRDTCLGTAHSAIARHVVDKDMMPGVPHAQIIVD